MTPATGAPDESTHLTWSVLSWAKPGNAKNRREIAKKQSSIDVQKFFFMAISIFGFETIACSHPEFGENPDQAPDLRTQIHRIDPKTIHARAQSFN